MLKILKNPASLILWSGGFILAALISIHVRLYPLNFHIWSSTKEQASLMVVQKIKQSFFEEALRQNPALPPAVALQLAQEKMNETLRKQPQMVRNAIDTVNNQLVKQNPASESIYLLESDPFYFYNLTENIIEKGHMASTIRQSKYLNPLMNAPDGDWQPLSYHPWVGAAVFRIARLFDGDISLIKALGFTPIALAVLCLIPLFITCYLLGISPIISFLSALVFSLSPIFLKRSAFGWFDTDPYNLLFPFIMLCLLLFSFKERKHALFLGFLFGLTSTLHALIWQGWPLMFFISLGSVAAISCYAQFILKDKALKGYSLSFLGYATLFSMIGISLCFGFKEFFILIAEALGELVKFSSQGLSLWPSLFIAVGELKKTTAQGFWQATGGPIILTLGLSGFIIYSLSFLKRFKSEALTSHLILIVISLSLLSLSLRAERFTLFTLIPLSILSALSLKAVEERFLTKLKIPYHLKQIIPLGIVLALSLLLTAKAHVDITNEITPIYNNTWHETLSDIKQRTPADSIINTWWPPGHFIKAMAQRRVIFDGATLDEGEIGYWISNILLSNNEQEALGLLQMINTSRNQAFVYLTQQGFKASAAVKLLYAIAPLNPEETRAFLKAHLKEKQIEGLLRLTKAGKPHAYLLLYNELVDDNLIFKFTGGWDFSKVEKINENPSLLAQVPARGKESYIDFLWEIAGGRYKYSEPLNLVNRQDGKLFFEQGLIVEENSKIAHITSSTFGQGQPLSTFFLEGNAITEQPNPQGNLNYSVVLSQQDGQYSARLMDRPLANSMLIKLFFFDGKGLNGFKLFNNKKDLTGRTEIKTFEVNWQD